MATEIVKAEGSVPDLVPTPSVTSEITAEDVSLPRIYLGQFMSEAVKAQLVKPGSLFAAIGPDDQDPNVLWEFEDKPDKAPVFYVLALRKGKSYSEDGGGLELYDLDDPNAPEGAWVTYTYTVALPDVDPDVPFKLLLTKTGKPAAKQINTVLVKNAARGPAYTTAFRLTTAKRRNEKKNADYFVPRISVVEAKKDHIAIAEELSHMITSAAADFQATGEEPAI